MEQRAAWCFADAVAGSSARWHLYEGAWRTFPRVDDPQRFLDRVDDLDSADQDAAERVAARRPQSRFGRDLSRGLRQLCRVEVVARNWPGQLAVAVE